MEIKLGRKENNGSTMAEENVNKIGLMTYSFLKGDFITIDHTEVNREQHSRRVGKKCFIKLL